MNDRIRRHNQYYANAELRNVDDTYVFDAASGLYKPKSYNRENNSEAQTSRVIYDGPIDIRTRRDWFNILLTVLTLLVLVRYTDITGGIYGASQKPVPWEL
ncbi:MAG TPA: hypothetical protein VI386_29535 [Candidatus Sulfotelmatobacter sp.]